MIDSSLIPWWVLGLQYVYNHIIPNPLFLSQIDLNRNLIDESETLRVALPRSQQIIRTTNPDSALTEERVSVFELDCVLYGVL